MALEAKEILNFLGIAEVDSLDSFKDKFSPSFIRKDPETIRGDKDLFDKVVGLKIHGSRTAIKRAFKKHGVEFDEAVLDGKFEDAVENLFENVFTSGKAEVEKLKAEGAKTNDEKVQALEKALAEKDSEIGSWKVKAETVENEYNGYKTEVATKAKTEKVNAGKGKLYGDFKWSNTVAASKEAELIKTGFQSHIENNYTFDYDEQDNFIVTDKKGNKIPNPDKAGAYKTPEEVLKAEGIAKGVYSQSQQGGTVIPLKKEITTTATQPEVTDLRRKINTSHRTI